MAIRTRQQQVLEHVNQVGVSSVEDMARVFGVSEMTIRRDIEYLAHSKLLIKVKGGAQKITTSASFHEEHLQARLKINIPNKQSLARRALDFIEPGDTIFLDGSTTIICFAQALKEVNPEITVVTNSALVSMELAEAKNIRLISVGGVFDRETFCFCPMEESNVLVSLHVKKAFLSCTGLALGEGTYENSIFNRNVKRAAASISDEVYLLADATKLGKKALSRVLDMSEIDFLITEQGLSKKQNERLAERNIQVCFC